MKLTVLAVSLALACAFTSAEARPKSSLQKMQIAPGCSDPVMKPCVGADRLAYFGRGNQRKANKHRHKLASTGLKGITHWNTVSRPARYIAGRLVCAVNVNAELARRGIRGTGSALAKSFLHWGRASQPVAGAVAVYGRRGGGHVAIVSRVVNGRVYVWNPSSRRHQWREVEYRKRAIAYRMAAQ